MDKIEFYKNRSLGERFSASAGFVRQNWKVMYKIILIPAIPLALLLGYFQQVFLSGYTATVMEVANSGNFEDFYDIFGSMGIYLLGYLLLTVILYAISGAIMSRYEADLLTKETTLKDLSKKIVSNTGKLALIILTMLLLGIVAVIIFALFVVLLTKISMVLLALVYFLFVVALIAMIPPLYLIFFPALFQGTSIFKSIRKGLGLGFKNWGTTFVIVLIMGIATLAISSLLQIPYSIWLLSNVGQSITIVSYILGSLSALSSAIVTPLLFVFLAFQYFAITEKAEGISLQAKIEEFDTL